MLALSKGPRDNLPSPLNHHDPVFSLLQVKTRKEIEIHEMDGKLQEEYEDRLKKALEELREVYDKQMQQNRDDFAKLYDNRVRRRDPFIWFEQCSHSLHIRSRISRPNCPTSAVPMHPPSRSSRSLVPE